MSTLIFGGAGFVGLNVAEALLRAGRDVVLFDRAPPPAAARDELGALGGGLRILTGDVRDRGAVAGAFDRTIDTVVYGAAITADAPRDAAEPELVLETNLLALVPVLRGARDRGVRRVVNLSSAAAYGTAAFAPGALDEGGTAPDPRTLYALSKFATERVGERLGTLWGVDFRSARLSTVFGPWERATGARDTLSPFMQLLLLADAGMPALLARSGDRDWIYAPDVAAGVLALLDAARLRHAVYHLSTGRRYGVLGWGERLARLRPGFECRLARPGETPTVSLHADADRSSLATARAAEDCGFRAAFDLERSAVDLDAWARAHPGWFARTIPS
jgi:UDP-glucose 4-epimerase